MATPKPRDVLVNAIAEPDGTLRLYGRKGTYETEAFDGFWLRTRDARKLPRTWDDLISEPERGHVRVRWPEPARASPKKRLDHFYETVFQPRRIEPLEADVDPVTRYLVETPNVVFERDWKLFFFDIETEVVRDWSEPWVSRILSISWGSSTGKSGHIRAAAKTDEAEAAMLRTFVRLVDRHDIALAWNGKRFDFPVVQRRIERLDIPFDPRLTHWLDHLLLFKRYYLRGDDGGVRQSLRLEAIAEAMLGSERKVPVEAIAKERGFTRGDLYSWVWKNAPDLLREYNDQDVRLMRLLEERTGFVQLHLSLCRICRVLPGQRSIYPMTLVDGRLLSLGHSRGYRFPSRNLAGDADEIKPARGAFVPEAVVGLHESVAVLDFARMYPSIIRALNLSVETIDEDGDVAVPETSPRGELESGTLARFRSEPEGLFPEALRVVIEERKRYAKLKDDAEVGSLEWYDADRLSTACKVLANTFYGILLSPFSRYYRAEIGESVTSFGRLLLASTIAEVRRRGHRLVFGDTDSVAFPASHEDAYAIRDAMNGTVIPELLKRQGGKLGEVALEYEKRFGRVLITASKRYAGWFDFHNGKPVDSKKLHVKGLEIVRSDVCPAARTLQRALLEGIVAAGQTHDALWAALVELRDKFESGETPIPDLILRKAVTKKLDEYKGAKPVQVKVAEAMIARGDEVGEGSRIEFLITRNGPIIPDELVDPSRIDLQGYWNQHVYPPSERVLEAAFPNVAWAGFRFSKGHLPGQISIWNDHKVARLKPTPMIERPRARAVIPPVRLEVAEADVDAPRLARVLEGYKGPHPVRLTVVGPSSTTELSVPGHRIADPGHDQNFATALRTLGVRVRPAAGR